MKDPAFLFYYKDFELDTAEWEADAVGWYMRILCYQAGNGTLPSSVEELAQIARVKFSQYESFSDRWRDRLAMKFATIEGGRLRNEKLFKTICERGDFKLKKSVLASFANAIKYGKFSALDERKIKKLFKWHNFVESDLKKRNQLILDFINLSLSESVSDSLSDRNTANANVNANKEVVEVEEKIDIPGFGTHAIKTPPPLGPTFQDFWDLYDKKREPTPCRKEWSKLSQADRKEIMDYIPRYIESQPDKQFRKDPIRFLKKKTWKDEIIDRSQATTVRGRPTVGISDRGLDMARQLANS